MPDLLLYIRHKNIRNLLQREPTRESQIPIYLFYSLNLKITKHWLWWLEQLTSKKWTVFNFKNGIKSCTNGLFMLNKDGNVLLLGFLRLLLLLLFENLIIEQFLDQFLFSPSSCLSYSWPQITNCKDAEISNVFGLGVSLIRPEGVILNVAHLVC